MAFYPVDDGAQLRVVGTLSDGHTWNNVFWATLSGSLDQSTADIVTGLLAAAYSNLTTYWFTSTRLNEVVVTDYRTEGAPQFSSTAGLPLVGTASDNPLPSQTAALVSWKTAFRGKAGRGRTYIPGFTEAGSAGDAPVSGLRSALEAYVADMVASTFCMAHRFSGSSPATSGSRRLKPTPLALGVLHQFTSGIVQPAWATQRRRAVRV